MAVTATGAPAAPQQSWRDREYDLLVLADAAFRAGWRDRNQLIQALAVSLGEWGGTPKGGHNAGLNADGSVDYDAWQVNGSAHPWYDTTKLGDPYYAAWAAFRVWEQAGQSWSPWVAWTRGKAQQYIDTATKIADEYLAGGRAGGVRGPAARAALTPAAARQRAEQVVLNMVRAVKESARPNRAAADADASLADEGAVDDDLLEQINSFLSSRRQEDIDEEFEATQVEQPSDPSGEVWTFIPAVDHAQIQEWTRQGLKTNAARGAAIARAFGFTGTIHGVGARGNKSDHPHGNAIDLMVFDDTELGDMIARFYVQHASALGVKYVIWNGQIASANNGWQWRTYRHPAGRTDPTAMHLDHPHISFYGGS